MRQKDIDAIQIYNTAVTDLASKTIDANTALNLQKIAFANMSNASKAAVLQMNGQIVSLDHLGDAFNWAALKAQALNAAIGMGIGLLISLAVSTLTTLIDNYTRRAEIAHEATAETIAEYEKQESSIASLNDSLDKNYDKLRELHALKGTDKWNDTLEEQYKTLQRQTLELEQQLALEEAKDALTQKDVADKLKDEAEKTEGVQYYNPVDGNEAPHQASWWESFGVSGPITSSTTGLTVAWVKSQSETVQDAIDKLDEYNAILEKGDKLTVEQVEHYRNLGRFLSQIITQYQEWIKQGEGNPWLTAEIDNWKDLISIIQGVLNPDIYNFKGPDDTAGYVSRSIESAPQAVAAQIQGADKTDFLKQTSRDSEAYAWVMEQAHAAQMSVEAYVDELVKLGIMTDNVVPKQDDLASSLLDIAKVANNDLEDAAKAYEALESAVSDYNDAGFITDETLDSLNSKIPGVIEVLFDENGALNENAAEALRSTDALIAFIRAQLQAQLTAAQANYDNLKQELDDIQQKGLAAAAAMLRVHAAKDGLDAAKKNLADFEAWMKSGSFKSGSGRGGGGGSKSIYSKEYEQITDLTEHYIKMSEMRQKRMNEESSEYKAESRQQFLYYQQLAEQTYAEISRLRAKGYTEANADFRKLLQNYESYLGSMYSIAKAIWEQEKQERMEAVQDQIDAENDRWEAREKQLNHERDYYKALLELEQKYLDTIGDIHTEIRDLDKELAAAKVYPEGTNLDLFTDEEHDKLVAQLRDIEAEATELYTKYQEKLSSVSADSTYELSHITDEFQRQYEILLKQYEISKADLAVARARRELENVLNERNVAMLVNGVWTWVADPESVKAAVEAVYEAEQTSEDALTDLFNTQRTQLLEETISNIELQRATEEAMHDKIIDGLQDSLEQVQKMEFCFEEFIQTLLEGTDGIASAFASAIAKLSGVSGNGKAGSGKNKQIVVSAGSKRPTGLNDGDIIYYRDSGGSVNPILVGGPNPLPIGLAKGSLSKPAYTGTGNEWWNEVILKYGGKGWGPSFSTGGVVNFTGPAHLDGTQTDPEVIFNSADAAKLYHLVHTTPNLVDKLIGNVQAKFEAILPAGFKGSGNPSMTTDNSRKVYWNGNVLMEGHDADNFLTMLERVLPVV